MQKQLVLVPCGVALGLLAAWWVRPDSDAGATVLVVLALLLVQGLAVLAGGLAALVRSAVRHPVQPVAAVPALPDKATKSAAVLSTAIVAASMAAAAHAADLRRPVVLTLANASDVAIEEAYVGPPGGAGWGPDVLGLRIVRPHQTVTIAAVAAPGCVRDIRVVYADGRFENRLAVDVCHRRRVAFHGPDGGLGGDAIVTLLRPARGIAPSTRGVAAAAPLHPVRVFMSASGIPPQGAPAYGVMALRATPTPASSARLTMACLAFLSHLPEQSDLPASVPLSAQMLTIWPLKPAARLQAEQGSCPAMLQSYDLPGGLDAIRDAESQTRELAGRGPFLIGWSPSRTRGVRDAVVLVLDMSDFDSQDSFDDAFVFWQRKIVEDPRLWRHGFSMERLRLAVRDFVDHYGSSIQAAIRVWGGHG